MQTYRLPLEMVELYPFPIEYSQSGRHKELSKMYPSNLSPACCLYSSLINLVLLFINISLLIENPAFYITVHLTHNQ